MSDELIRLAIDAALKAGCCERCPTDPDRLVTVKDADDDVLAEREIAAWNLLVKNAHEQISKTLDPDLDIQPALIFVLQSVEE